MEKSASLELRPGVCDSPATKGLVDIGYGAWQETPLRGDTRLSGPAALPGEASPGEASSSPRSWATCMDSAGRTRAVGGGRLISTAADRGRWHSKLRKLLQAPAGTD